MSTPTIQGQIDESPVPDYVAMLGLEGRVFVVLGCGAGIGRQTAHALAQAGARVACVDHDASLAGRVAAETGGVAFTADITERAAMQHLFDEVAKRLGPVRGVVDIVGMPLLKPLAEFDDDLWQAQFRLVIDHAFLAIQIGGHAIAEAGGGAMVFVASIAGVGALPGQSAYGAAKAGLIHLVTGAAGELGPKHVRVNAVAPGFVRTPRLSGKLNDKQWKEIERGIPLGAAGIPGEIAAPILFLSSDLASYVTGQTLIVDGGAVGAVPTPNIL